MIRLLIAAFVATLLGVGGLSVAGSVDVERASATTTGRTTTGVTTTGRETDEDVRGPCDEAEHRTDPRCTGTPIRADDRRGRHGPATRGTTTTTGAATPATTTRPATTAEASATTEIGDGGDGGRGRGRNHSRGGDSGSGGGNPGFRWRRARRLIRRHYDLKVGAPYARVTSLLFS